MINASGSSGAPVTPAQPAVTTPTPVVPAPGTGIPAAPTTPAVAPAGSTPAPAIKPVSAPATTPVTPANAVAGASNSGKLTPPAKKLPIKLIIGGIVLLLLVIGGIAAYLLSQSSQDVRQQASEPTYNDACIAKFGGNAMLMAQEVTACENQTGKSWNAVECECQNDATPPGTPTDTRKCGPGAPKYNSATQKCGPFYSKDN